MEKLLGHYFPYCQFCVHDGNCELKHHELMGVPSAGKVDETPYNHEDLGRAFTAFQGNLARGACAGQIMKSESIFFPLMCECGSVVDSDCQKLSLNTAGRKRLKLAKRIAAEKGIKLSEVDPDDLPALDPNYEAAEGL